MAREGKPIISLPDGGASENIKNLDNIHTFVTRSKSDSAAKCVHLSNRGTSPIINKAIRTGTSLGSITSELEALSLNQTEIPPGLLPRGKMRSSDSDNQSYSNSTRQRYTTLNPMPHKNLGGKLLQSDMCNYVTHQTGACVPKPFQNCQNRQLYPQEIPGVIYSMDATLSPFMPQRLPHGFHSNINMPSDPTTMDPQHSLTQSYVNNAILPQHYSVPTQGLPLDPTSELLQIVDQKLNCQAHVTAMNNDKGTLDHFANQQTQDSEEGNFRSEEHFNGILDGEKTADVDLIPPELFNRFMYIINNNTIPTNGLAEQLKDTLSKQQASNSTAIPNKNSGSTNSNYASNSCSRIGLQVNSSNIPSFLDHNGPNLMVPPYPLTNGFTHTFRGTDNNQYPSPQLAHLNNQTTATNIKDAFIPPLRQCSGFVGQGYGKFEASWSPDPTVTNIPSQKSKDNQNKPKIVNLQLNAPFKFDFNNPPAKEITSTTTVSGQVLGQRISCVPIQVEKRTKTIIMDPNNPGINRRHSAFSANELPPASTRTIGNRHHGMRQSRPNSVGASVQTSFQAAPGPIIYNSQDNQSILKLYPIQPIPQHNSAASHSSHHTLTMINVARRKIADISREELVSQDTDGDTILHKAIIRSKFHHLKAFLERCERETLLDDVIDKRNNLGQTPLYVATAINQTISVRELIKFGANPNHMVQCKRMITEAPIHCAAQGGLPCVTTLKELLHSKALILDLRNSEGLTALHCAIQEHGKFEGGCKKTSIVTTELLIRAGADPNAQDMKSGKTPLMYAIETKDYNLVSCMVNLIDTDKLRNMLKTQTRDGSNCSKICSGLRMDTDAWKKMNFLLFSVEKEHTQISTEF